MTQIDWRRSQTALARRGFDPGPIDGAPGVRTYAAALSYVARRPLGEFGTRAGATLATMIPKYGVNSSADALAQFFANTCHETGGYRVFAEGMAYSAKRLMEVWPTRFPTLKSAIPYAWDASDPDREDIALANYVYGGRLGNEDNGTADMDGWNFRGGGWIQTTGKDNYRRAQAVTGLPLLTCPELLHDPITSIEPACAFWKGVGCNSLAVIDTTGRAARIKVNGGTIGLNDVMKDTARILQVIVPIAA